MSLTISFPYPSPVNVITLPSPEFGDIHRLDTNEIVRSTQGGELLTYRDPDWPILESFIYQFKNVKRSIAGYLGLASELRNALETYAGQQVRITDHLGNTRDGYIVSPDIEMIAVDEGPSDACDRFDLSFEFHMTFDNDDYWKLATETPEAMTDESDEELVLEAYS